MRLLDKFGDGWGNASLILVDPDNEVSTFAPTCGLNPLDLKLPGDADGLYYFIVTTPNNQLIQNMWEIYWTVSLVNNGVTEIYTGGYNTSLVFDFDRVRGAWSLVYWNNILSNELPDQSCANAERYTCMVGPAGKSGPASDGKQGALSKSSPGGGGKEFKSAMDKKGSSSKSNASSKKSASSKSSAGKSKSSAKLIPAAGDRSKSEPKPKSAGLGLWRYLTADMRDRFAESDNRKTTGSAALQPSRALAANKDAPKPKSKSLWSSEQGMNIGKSVVAPEIQGGGPSTKTKPVHMDDAIGKGKGFLKEKNDPKPKPANQFGRKPGSKPAPGLSDDGAVIRPFDMSRFDVVMYDFYGLGWQKTDYTGAMFFITDDTMTNLISYGSLAGGIFSGICSFCFTNGAYYLRVAAPVGESGLIADSATRWSFCGTSGKYSEQLSFHILDGICVPDLTIDVKTSCTSSILSEITTTGSIMVNGLTSEFVSHHVSDVMSASLLVAVNGWGSANVQVKDFGLNIIRASSINNMNSYYHLRDRQRRKLSAFSVTVDFAISFAAETVYGVDGTSYSAVLGLIQSLEQSLNSTIASGAFMQLYLKEADEMGITGMESVTGFIFSGLQLLQRKFTFGSREVTTVEPDVISTSYEGSASAVTSYALPYHIGVVLQSFLILAILSIIFAIAFNLLVIIRYSQGYSAMELRETDSVHSDSTNSSYLSETNLIVPLNDDNSNVGLSKHKPAGHFLSTAVSGALDMAAMVFSRENAKKRNAAGAMSKESSHHDFMMTLIEESASLSTHAVPPLKAVDDQEFFKFLRNLEKETTEPEELATLRRLHTALEEILEENTVLLKGQVMKSVNSVSDEREHKSGEDNMSANVKHDDKILSTESSTGLEYSDIISCKRFGSQDEIGQAISMGAEKVATAAALPVTVTSGLDVSRGKVVAGTVNTDMCSGSCHESVCTNEVNGLPTELVNTTVDNRSDGCEGIVPVIPHGIVIESVESSSSLSLEDMTMPTSCFSFSNSTDTISGTAIDLETRGTDSCSNVLMSSTNESVENQTSDVTTTPGTDISDGLAEKWEKDNFL